MVQLTRRPDSPADFNGVNNGAVRMHDRLVYNSSLIHVRHIRPYEYDPLKCIMMIKIWHVILL